MGTSGRGERAHHLRPALVVLAAAGALAACGSSTPSSTTTAGPGPSTTGATGAGSTTTAGGSLSVALDHVPTGTVKLSWSPTTKRLRASFDMYGFTPGSSHAVHLHSGKCSQPGSVLVSFPDLSANRAGDFTGTLVSTATTPKDIPAGSYLNVHLAASAQLGKPGSLTYTPIACGDVPISAKDFATFTMSSPPQGNEQPAGKAVLTYDPGAKKLTVVVSMGGLVPGSSHAAHIHQGSCQSQGPVKYPLTTLTAGSSGAARAITVIPGVTSPPPASGWYVNVHLGAPSQLSGAHQAPSLYFQPIDCGNVS